jgi:hypothetical protein
VNLGPYIAEKFIDAISVGRITSSTYDEIFSNPTQKEFNDIPKSYKKYARGLITSKEVYVWAVSSNGYNHSEMKKHLGLNDTLPVFIEFNGKKVEMHFSDSYWGDAEKDTEKILKHPFLKKFKLNILTRNNDEYLHRGW